MKTKIFSFILAFCLSANPIYSTNNKTSASDKSHQKNFELILANIHRKAKVMLPNKVKNLLPFDVEKIIYQYYNDPLSRDTIALENNIEALLPEFCKQHKQNLEGIQEGNRQAVLVIGQTGAGKSTLIGGLLGHKFVIEKKTVIKICDNGTRMSFKEKVLVNKGPDAPKIGHSTATSETTLPEVFLDKKTNLAFIDTAGLSDTRKNGDAINIWSALGIRSFIEKIGNIQCIIGVISYNNFKEGRGSKAFLELLCVTNSLIKSTSLATCASSMVLVFTKVPKKIKEKDIANGLKKQCYDLEKMRKNNQMTSDHELAEAIYKALFPSYYGLQDSQDVPFFRITQNTLLKIVVRKRMLPTIQNAKKVEKKHIGLVLTPYLIQQTQNWLTKKAETVANDIREKESIEYDIQHTQDNLSSKQEGLREKQRFLQQLTNPDSKNKKNEKEKIVDNLINTIYNSTQEIKKLDIEIEEKINKINNKKKKIKTLNTETIKFYKRISCTYDKITKQYKYNYNDVPIDYIVYDGLLYKTTDPKTGDRISDMYTASNIKKNYRQGRLDISLESNISTRSYVTASILGATVGTGVAIASITLGGMSLGGLVSGGIVGMQKMVLSPLDFKIYAKKKDIYYFRINTLEKDIHKLKKISFERKNDKKKLQKEIEDESYQLEEVMSDLSRQEEIIKKTKNDINTRSKEVEKIQHDLQNLNNQLKPFNGRLKQNEIIPYIITQVEPFINFHTRYQEDIDACKRYMNSLMEEENKKRDPMIYQLQATQGGKNNKQFGLSSKMRASITLGIGVLSRLLKKKN